MKRCATISLYLGLVLITILLFSGAITSSVAFAADGDVAHIYDRTDVTKDLEGSEGFDFSQYPADASKDTQIYTFLEYGYDGADNSKFGLYLYVYNPKQKAFSTSSASNKANVAMAFDEKDNAASYQRVGLIFCSATSDKLFYKFRIDDGGKLLALAEKYALTHGGARRYDIATVELFAYGDKTATTSTIGKSYECTGFMKGFGADKENNTHSVKAYSLDVLDIELNHTFFRPDGNSSAQSDYTVKDQLDSVYFSFPNELINSYGGIWKIEASYYSAMTSPILVTSTREVYDAVINYVGQQLSSNPGKLQGSVDCKFNKDIPYSLYDPTYAQTFGDKIILRKEPTLTWNLYAAGRVPAEQQIIYYLFYTGYETPDGSIPYAKDFTLSGERLLDYIYNYKKSYRFGKSELVNDKGEQLSMDLFQGYMPTGEQGEILGKKYEVLEHGKVHYVPISMTAADGYTLESYKRTPTAFDWFTLYKGKYDYEKFSDIQAIVPIDVNDSSLSKAEFCKKYYVSESDYDSIIAKVNAGKGKETVYLFRFAQSEYKARGVITRGDLKLGQEYAYIAEESVYLNMNLASITCRKNDVYHTFAVASNPINAAADIEPNVPFDYTQYYKDLWESVKDWFEGNKSALIITAIVIVVVILAVLIIVTLVKIAPYFAMMRISRSQSSSKQRSKSKNKTKNKSAKKHAGRSHNGKKTSLSKSQ